jgi:hypothetical protein
MISDSSGPPALAQVASSPQPFSSLTDPGDLKRLSDAIGLLDQSEIAGLLGLVFIENRDLDRDMLEALEGLVAGRPKPCNTETEPEDDIPEPVDVGFEIFNKIAEGCACSIKFAPDGRAIRWK